MDFIKLTEDQVYEVSLVTKDVKYTKGERSKNGETYNRYRYDGIIFIVDSKDPFCALHESGKLTTIKLGKGTREITDDQGATQTVPSLNLDSWQSFEQATNRVIQQTKLEAIKQVAKQEMSAEMLSAVMSIAI